MKLSYFAEHVDMPLCQYFDECQKFETKSTQNPISFLKGDPIQYGKTNFRMPNQGKALIKLGYDILKKNIMIQQNSGYTLSSGVPSAKESIRKLYKSKIPFQTSDIFINHGVNMGLLSVLMAFCNEGDQILIPEFGYPFYTDLCPAMKLKAKKYKLKKDKNFQIDLQHAKSLITQSTQFIYIVNPNNPTGTIYSQSHMKDILAFADQNQLPIVCDEVYMRQNFASHKYISFGQLTEDVPVIVLSGVQKILSVPGWATAWIAVFDKNKYIQQIKANLAVVSTIFLHSNRFTQAALPQILDKVGLFTTQRMGTIQQLHDMICQQFKNIPHVIAYPGQATIYIAVEVNCAALGFQNDKQFAKQLHQTQNISVLPLSCFGNTMQGFRLITCATKQLYEDFFKRLANFIQSRVK